MVVIAKVKIRSGKEAEAEAAFRKQIETVKREEPETLLYVLHRSRKEPATFAFYEKYANDAAFDRHGKTPWMQELFKTLTPLLDGAPSIETYEEIAGKH